jgi:hypothetical protein
MPIRNSVRTIATAATIITMLTLSATVVAAETDAHKSFELLKQMEGNWAGQDGKGQAVKVSFRSTAGGSAIMSEIQGHGENMITMFHMDGDHLLMTHYCGAGNQPRMKVTSADAKSISFEFMDGTNIGPGDGHMQGATFSLPDENHQLEGWTFVDHGKEMKELFTLERVK